MVIVTKLKETFEVLELCSTKEINYDSYILILA